MFRLRRVVLAAVCLSLSGCREPVEDAFDKAHRAVLRQAPAEALTEFSRVMELTHNDDSSTAKQQRIRALKGAGDVYYFEMRRFPDAVKVYEQQLLVSDAGPEALESRLNLAEILHRHFDDARGAIAHFTKALAMNPPQAAELRYRVAKMYFEIADYKQAELEAEHVTKHFEASGFADDAWMLKAQAQALQTRSDDALRTYNELVSRFPDSELVPHAQFEMGKIAAENDKPEEAIERWVQVLKKHPEPSIVQKAIARARVQLAKSRPKGIGERAIAFDRVKPPKSSAEAMGVAADTHASD